MSGFLTPQRRGADARRRTPFLRAHLRALVVLGWRWWQHSRVLWRCYPALLEAAALRGVVPMPAAPADLATAGSASSQTSSAPVLAAPSSAISVPISRRSVWIVTRHECRPRSFYAGMRMILFLALELAEHGYDVTFLTVDPRPLEASDAELLAFISADLGKPPPGRWASRRVEDINPDTLAGPDDLAVASCWESFRVARRIAATCHSAVPLYLIQDDERIFYPHSSAWLEVLRSYHAPAHRLFSGQVLAEHFKREQLAPSSPGRLQAAYTCFVDPLFVAAGQRRAERLAQQLAAGDLPSPRLARLCFYGRPEVHRNGYDTLLDALSRLDPASLALPLEIVALGAPVPLVKLGNGLSLHGLGKLTMADYAAVLATMDLGVSLMFSPHPSYPPLEMAAAGVRVLTNTWPGKDPSLYSPAIRGVDLVQEDLAAVITAEVQALAHGTTPPPQPLNPALVTHDRRAVMAAPVRELLALLPVAAGTERA